jgi:hypothetical protein
MSPAPVLWYSVLFLVVGSTRGSDRLLLAAIASIWLSALC